MRRKGPAALWLGMLALLLGACTLLFGDYEVRDAAGAGGGTGGVDASATTSTASGGSGGVGTSSNSAAGGGGGCISPADCPPPVNECVIATCTAGTCGTAFVASGTDVSSQTPGDCHTRRCDGSGNVVDEVDDTDAPVDHNLCTIAGCSSAGTPVHTAYTGAGTTCSTDGSNAGAACDNYGTCVGCTSAYDCQTDSRCTNPTNPNCAHSKCVTGVNLVAGCDPPPGTGPKGCVQEICAPTVDPACCIAASSTAGCSSLPCQVQSSKPIGCPASVQAAIDSVMVTLPACGAAWTQACVDKFRQQPGIGCGWDAACVSKVGTVCQIDCSVDAGTGQCLPWIDGERSPFCAGVDLTLGRACDSYVSICNRGQTDVSGPIRLWYYPANSGHIPADAPTGSPLPTECIVTKTISAGTCVDVTQVECPLPSTNREIIVNPQGLLTNPAPIKECTAENNWTLYSTMFACTKPICPGRTVVASRPPVNLFVTLDRSASMSALSLDGVTTKDSLAKGALAAFFQNTAVAGTRIFFRRFGDAVDGSPAGSACFDKTTCTGTSTTGTEGTEVAACSVPDAISGCDPTTSACTLPSTSLFTWMSNKGLNSNDATPSLIALLGAEKWAMAYKAAHPDEGVAVILLTDGAPSSGGCSTLAYAAVTDPAYGVTAAYNAGVRTYVIGMYDTSAVQTATDFLYFDPIAAAGQGHLTCSALDPCPAPGTCTTCKSVNQTCSKDADCCAGYGSCISSRCSVGTPSACRGLAVDASNATVAQLHAKLVGIHGQAAGCTWQIDACRGAGAACAANANCCSNVCSGGVCIGGNGAIDPATAYVTYTPSMGVTTSWVPNGCDVFDEGAYFDNAAAPTTLTLCPATCETVQSDPNPVIRLSSGC